MSQYRKNVAALIVCQEKYVGCLRSDNVSGSHKAQLWQCVQGGVELEDTSYEEALFRELLEELGIEKKYITIKYTSKNWRHYDFPHELRLGSDKKNFCGQEQLWHLVEIPSLDQIKLISSDRVFSEVKLYSIEELLALYPPWKKKPFEEFCQELNIAP